MFNTNYFQAMGAAFYQLPGGHTIDLSSIRQPDIDEHYNPQNITWVRWYGPGF